MNRIVIALMVVLSGAASAQVSVVPATGIEPRFPKADVFFSVSEDLAASAGSKAEAMKIEYGLKP